MDVFAGPKTAKHASLICLTRGDRQLSTTLCFTLIGRRVVRCGTAWTDEPFAGETSHLHSRDTSFVLVSRAPIGKIKAYKKRSQKMDDSLVTLPMVAISTTTFMSPWTIQSHQSFTIIKPKPSTERRELNITLKTNNLSNCPA